MIRVLHVFHNMGNGGIEHFVMDRYRKLDRNSIQFDFLMTSYEAGYFDDEIRQLGGRIYHTCSVTKNPIKCFLQIRGIVKKNNYRIVHRHTGNAIAYFDLLAAKFGGADKLIIHSHNNSAEKILLHKLAKRFLAFDCLRVACSNSAGKWLFHPKNFIVMKNGIETQKYLFNEKSRYEYRRKYCLPEDSFVIGHVGRIDYQKNHEFLIEILNEALKIKPNTYLMCIGDGNLKDTVKYKAKQLEIDDRIVFIGSIDNVDEVINCFDVFCFPSRYEGFGITLIEAQTNGLKCVASKGRVSEESNVSGNVTYVSLDEPAKKWAETICGMDCQRDLSACDRIVDNGYDLKHSVLEMERFYKGLFNEGAVQ